ncbi:hypothetical protein KJ751_00370 [Patescibacteria group bacterium]|nr:hypothetical protein [Patescibacteria group bacterium]
MNSGLIKLVVIIIIGIVVLSILNIDVRSLLDNKLIHKNFSFLWNNLKDIYNYLQTLIERTE